MWEVKPNKAFTLIELLIVMAILGVMAVIVLVAINPTEQISKAQDTGRISSVNQLGHQIQAYYTSMEGLYPDPDTWDQDLVNTNSLGSFPPGAEYIISNGVTNCSVNPRPSVYPNYCYSFDNLNSTYGAIVFSKLESLGQRSKCTVVGEFPYFVYSTVDGRGGVICASSDPSPWSPGSVSYLP